MDITYLGHSSFRIRGKSASIVTDPYESAVLGIAYPKHVSCDIVTVSHNHADHNATKILEGSPFVVNGPGEYEIKGVGIVGISVFHDNEGGVKRGQNTVYRIEIDGMSVVHLGDLGHTLTDSQVESLGVVDILFVPVGGVYTINAQEAANVVHEVEPSMVIPMHFGRSDLDQKAFGQLQPLSVFLKEMGSPESSGQPKLVITKDKLPEELQVIVLHG